MDCLNTDNNDNPNQKIQQQMQFHPLSEKIKNNLQDIYNQIKGKKVFIFDLETTGLFETKNFYKYWDNAVFDSSRIVEIGYYYSDNFDSDININENFLNKKLDDILGCVEGDAETINQLIENTIQSHQPENDFIKNNIIHSYLRKPTDFISISSEAESKHGISLELLQTAGFKFSQILNSDLLKKLNDAEYVISHNTIFDFSVLLNELNRFKLKNTIQHLQEIKKSKKLLCTCKASGFMTLEKLHKSIINESPEVFHRAGDDVKTLVEIIVGRKLNLVLKTML
jgi:DNA polymerase III epsilon subunit-like protein